MAIVVIAGLVISMLYSRFVKKKGLELSAAESASLNFGKEEIDILINSDFGRCKEHLKGRYWLLTIFTIFRQRKIR